MNGLRIAGASGALVLAAQLVVAVAAAQAIEPGAVAEVPAATASAAGADTAAPVAGADVPASLADVQADSAFDFLPRTAPGRGGLTEARMIEHALSVSARMRGANAAAEVATRRADRAVVIFVPRLDLSARYMRLSEVPVPAPIRDLFPPQLDSYSLRAAVKVPITDYFLSLKDRYDSAQRLEKFADLQREAERQEVVYAARREYYELARALSAHTLSTHRVAQLERFVQEIDVLVQGGELGIVALAHARTRLATARATAERDRANQRVAEETVRRRLALPLGAPVGIAEALTGEPSDAPVALEQLLLEADGKRPEVLALRELIAAHEHTSAATAAGRYPSLSLIGDINLDNPNQRYIPLRDQFDESWALGVEVTWSPTELAAQNDALDSSRLEATRARAELDDLRSRVVVEITSAYEQGLAASASRATFEEAVAAAQQALAAELALFHAGETTSRQVLDAELDLRTAQLQWVDVVLSAHLARAALERAVGRTP